MQTDINGKDVIGHEQCRPDERKQVWGCGRCEGQGHRLLEDGAMECGQCCAESAFQHYVPEKKPIWYSKHPMRLVKSNSDGRDNYICGRCGFSRFHVQQSGTLTCYRCRHAVQFRWWNPVTGEPERV